MDGMHDRTKSREPGSSRSKRTKNGQSQSSAVGVVSTVGGSLSASTSPSVGVPPTFKRRKRGRKARVVVPNRLGEPSMTPSPAGILGGGVSRMHHTYTTTLVRRAIRKRNDSLAVSVESLARAIVTQQQQQQQQEEESYSETYGDVSLGMKLIVAGGKVIVQTLNALDDGRASPAQLTGLIQRGDVLLAIEDISLTQLPIDQLMTSLQPLSAPETRDGRYRKTLNLRLEAGTGHELLKMHERGVVPHPSMDTPTAAVNEMFSLFPMVDQLSGTPLFEPISHDSMETKKDYTESLDKETPEPADKDENDHDETSEDALAMSLRTQESTSREAPTPDEVIAALVAEELSQDRTRFASLYFDWSDGFSERLRAVSGLHETSAIASLTKTQRIELGIKVMKLTEQLTHNMEDIYKGKDLRSFKIWSTNFSMRSGATLRRRAVMDAASLRSHRGHREAPHDQSGTDDESGFSRETDSGGSLDPDALLLGLAAHDDIWRNNVLEALKEVIRKMENGEDNVEDENQCEKKEDAGDIDKALSNELESFLFGENMNKFVKKKKRSYALPPEDITTVLFDLSTQITTAAPDEVTVFGGTANSFSIQSSFGTQAKTKAQQRADILLARYFLLDEALPVWLESFRPLGLDQRRLFWPVLRHSGFHAGTTTHVSDNDSLTVDSHDAIPKAAGRKKKNIQEMIEDLELDIESRSETCFLVTYYFSQKILTKYSRYSSDDERAAIDMEVATFLQKFGTYLQIHSCLVFSAQVEADKAIDQLLQVARFDPLHREATKELAKASDLTFYDTTKLSALLEFLSSIWNDRSQHRDAIKNLCVAAYPDIQPWQVRKACLGSPLIDGTGKTASPGEDQEDLYFAYLSQLLDPVEGHESARRDSKLVIEWCKWSTGISFGANNRHLNRDRVKYFYLVASRASSAHLSFRRDLLALLEMSMAMKEYDLALDLTSEIIEDRKLCNRPQDVEHVLRRLREIAKEGLQSAWTSKNDGNGFHLVKRVLRAFHDMSTSKFLTCSEAIQVPRELLSLLDAWEKLASPTDNAATTDLTMMVDFMINESAPSDVLRALALWSSTKKLGTSLYPRLESVLRRAAQRALKSEISSSLLQLKHIRSSYREENAPLATGIGAAQRVGGGLEAAEVGIWKQMSLGGLVIDK